jgi:hypothetical protein
MPPLFTLPAIAVRHLGDFCRTYHGIWRKTKLTAHHLEEALVNALSYYEPYEHHLVWKSNSHSAKADIQITAPTRVGLSIKSGTSGKGKYRDMLSVSGHRLTRAQGDLNTISTYLRELIPDVMLCFVHNATLRHYECLYIDAAVFLYPTDARQWVPQMGEKRGKVSQYLFTSPGGLIVSVKPPLSWQVWWTIPRKLCRQGPCISYASS